MYSFWDEITVMVKNKKISILIVPAINRSWNETEEILNLRQMLLHSRNINCEKNPSNLKKNDKNHKEYINITFEAVLIELLPWMIRLIISYSHFPSTYLPILSYIFVLLCHDIECLQSVVLPHFLQCLNLTYLYEGI